MVQSSIAENKAEITIGVLGQDGHGKTTRTAAITRSLARLNDSVVEGDEIVITLGDCLEDRTRPSIYETDSRRYTHVDCRRHIHMMKNLILNWIPWHGAILVVSAVDGITLETREQVRLARVVGIPAMVVFLSKCDLTDDSELLEMVEFEVRGLLSEHGYAADTPIIRGSALAALNSLETTPSDIWNNRIRELLEALDTAIAPPQKAEDKPFLMSIEDVFTVTGRGAVVVGQVERGRCQITTPVEIVGLGPTRASIATALQLPNKISDSVTAGENAGLLLRGLNRTDAHRGQVLAAPGTIKACSRFRADLYLCTERENGPTRPDLSGVDYLFFLRTREFSGTLCREEGNDLLREGEIVRVHVDLETTVAMEPELRFTLRQNGRSIGYGVVTEPLS